MIVYLQRRKSIKRRWPVTIYYDDRERNPFDLNEDKFRMVKKRLKTGDYTMKGFEDTLCIEKKSGIKEVLINICRGDRARFKKLLERMSKFKYKYFIIEDSPDRVAKVLRSIPDCRMSPRTFYFWVAEITIRYSIPVIFTGHRPDVSKAIVNEIFTQLLEKDLK
ncbi:MAG: hypothetical protein FVQ80_11560 [Planctomycetes bacterium]|nr:hypothetical protein [Planctomycetota bacterium]